MRKLKFVMGIAICTFIIFISLNIVHALTETTTLSCTPVNSIAGGTITCTLNANITEDSISGVEGTITLSEGLELTSCTVNSVWEGNCNNGVIGLYTDINKSGNTPLLSFVVTVKSNTIRGNQTISIPDFAYSDASFNLIHSTISQSTILIKSKINTLSQLNVSGLSLSPNFTSETTSYTTSTSSASAVINATLTDSNSSFVNGFNPRTVDLSYGSNQVLIKVNSESGVVKTYTINITRNDTRSDVNTIATLVPSTGSLSPAFSPSISNYTINVDQTVESINFDSTLTDSKSNFIASYGPRRVNIEMGNNTILFKVKSEKGTEKIYTITVTKSDKRSDVNTIATLVPSTGSLSPAFSPSISNYTINVDQTVESINFDSTLTNSKSSFVASYGPRRVNIKTGSNTILFKVKSEKGTEKIYTITVNKTYKKSDNANLSSIILSSGSIAFKSNVLKYNVSVPYNISTLEISAVKADSAAKVEGIGNKTLNVGVNSFDIKVTAESGTTKTYTIAIEREHEPTVPSTLDDNNTLNSLKINGNTIDFKPSVLEYNFTVEHDVKELSINAIAASSKAKVNITGNENLEDKSEIQVVVTAENGTNKIYKIRITKEEKSVIIVDDPQDEVDDSSTIAKPAVINKLTDKTKSFIIIILYVVLFIGLSAALIYKKKKAKK